MTSGSEIKTEKVNKNSPTLPEISQVIGVTLPTVSFQPTLTSMPVDLFRGKLLRLLSVKEWAILSKVSTRLKALVDPLLEPAVQSALSVAVWHLSGKRNITHKQIRAAFAGEISPEDEQAELLRAIKAVTHYQDAANLAPQQLPIGLKIAAQVGSFDAVIALIAGNHQAFVLPTLVKRFPAENIRHFLEHAANVSPLEFSEAFAQAAALNNDDTMQVIDQYLPSEEKKRDAHLEGIRAGVYCNNQTMIFKLVNGLTSEQDKILGLNEVLKASAVFGNEDMLNYCLTLPFTSTVLDDALRAAASYNQLSVLKILLSCGKISTHGKESALSAAVNSGGSQGNSVIVKELLSNPLSQEISANAKERALHDAYFKKIMSLTDSVAVLLSAPGVRYSDEILDRIADHATVSGDIGTLTMMLNHHSAALLNPRLDFKSFFRFAISRGRPDVVRCFLEALPFEFSERDIACLDRNAQPRRDFFSTREARLILRNSRKQKFETQVIEDESKENPSKKRRNG